MDCEKYSKSKIILEILTWIRSLIVVFVLVAIMNSQVFALTTVMQSSMESTLLEGDILVLDKISYNFKEPKRGDVIVFLLEGRSDGIANKFSVFFHDLSLKITRQYRDDRLIKRIIGIPGDEIDIHDGNLFINGDIQEESYVTNITEEKDIEFPIIIPKGYIFVMGDNRMESMDSRDFGLINYKNIEGRIALRVLPLNRFGRP